MSSLEEVALLSVSILNGNVGALCTKRELEKEFSMKISLAKLYVALMKLIRKSYLRSITMEHSATEKERPQRFYQITEKGRMYLLFHG